MAQEKGWGTDLPREILSLVLLTLAPSDDASRAAAACTCRSWAAVLRRRHCDFWRLQYLRCWDAPTEHDVLHAMRQIPMHSFRDDQQADALVAGMQQVARPQLMLLRAKPSADYQSFPWVVAPPPLPPLHTPGAWGERYRVARMHDLTLGAHRHPLLYGCVVPSACSAPKAVRLSNLTALLQLSDGAAGATRWRPPAARVFRYSPHTVWLEDRPRVDAPAPEEERGNEDDAAERQRSGQTEESDSEESSDEQSDDDSSAEESDDGSDQLQHPAVVGKQLQHASPWALFVMAAAVQYDARPERPHHSTAHTRGELEGGGGGSAPPHAEAEHRHGVFCAHELPRGAVVCEVSGVGRQLRTQSSGRTKYGRRYQVRMDVLSKAGQPVARFCWDSLQLGSVSRFLRTSRSPNVAMTVIHSPKQHLFPRLAVTTLRTIAAGEELVWDDVCLIASPKVRSKAKREPSHVRELHTEPARESLAVLLYQLRQSKLTMGDEGVYAIYI